MINASGIRPDDRVLILDISDTAGILELARKLNRGLLVGIGPDDDVRLVRRDCAAAHNVMIVPSDPTGTIPWQDHFFSVVVAHSDEAGSREVARVLAPGGKVLVLER